MGARSDPYLPPAAETLFAPLPDEVRALAAGASRRLGRKAATVRVDPWGWALRLGDPAGVVYLFPREERLVVVARMPRPAFEAGSGKATNACLTRASCVGDVIWAEWSLGTRPAFEAVFDLIAAG